MFSESVSIAIFGVLLIFSEAH